MRMIGESVAEVAGIAPSSQAEGLSILKMVIT